MTTDTAIRSIAILGGGIVALSAAAAFARALPGTRIALIDVPADPAALADHLDATLPAIGRFHDAIGLDERDLVRRSGATHRLGTLFRDWGDADWLHPLGACGPRGLGLFHQHWLIAATAGPVPPFHAFAPAAALALTGRYAPAIDDPASPLADVDVALRLDPTGYHAHLSALVRHLRVSLVAGDLVSAERREDGGIAALLLEGGRRIEADLFVDAAGPRARLLSLVEDRWEDWAEMLPCDRLLLAEPGPPALALLDEAQAVDCGWHWLRPGRGGTASGLAYRHGLTPDDAAVRAVEASGRRPAERIVIRPGRRSRSWVRNVVAIGDAAIALDPLGHANLHLAHSAILRAIELLPPRNFPDVVLDEFNRRVTDQTARVRDFQAALYHGAARTRGAFWRALADRPRSAGLDRTLTLYEARGHLPHFEDESFTREDWLTALIGMGLRPRLADAMASAADPAWRARMLDHALRHAQAAAGLARPYREAYAALATPTR